MEFTAEDAKVLIRAAWAVLSSPLAQRGAALALGAWIMFASLRSAIRADRQARWLIENARDEYKGVVSGRPAHRDETIEEQRDRILSVGPALRDAAWSSFIRSVRAGVLVPAAILMTMVMFYSWFDPAGGHLLDGNQRPLSHPAPIDAAIFVVDQTFRGGLFDALEVFDIQVAPFDNNPERRLFSLGVVAHHLFVETFIFSGLLLFAHSRWRIRQIERQTLDWFEDRTQRARQDAAAKAGTATPADTTH